MPIRLMEPLYLWYPVKCSSGTIEMQKKDGASTALAVAILAAAAMASEPLHGAGPSG